MISYHQHRLQFTARKLSELAGKQFASFRYPNRGWVIVAKGKTRRAVLRELDRKNIHPSRVVFDSIPTSIEAL